MHCGRLTELETELENRAKVAEIRVEKLSDVLQENRELYRFYLPFGTETSNSIRLKFNSIRFDTNSINTFSIQYDFNLDDPT